MQGRTASGLPTVLWKDDRQLKLAGVHVFEGADWPAHLCAKRVLSSRLSLRFDVIPDFLTGAVQSDTNSITGLLLVNKAVD